MYFWIYIASLVVIVLAVWLILRNQEKKWEREKQQRMMQKAAEENTFNIEDAIFSPDGVHKVLLDRLYGKDIELRPEPGNQYDENAVQVVWKSEHDDEFVLGYLFRGRLQDKVNEYIRAGREGDMLAFISEVITPEQYRYEEKKCLRVTVIFRK